MGRDGLIGQALVMAFEEAMEHLILGSSWLTGVCIRNFESMHGLFRIFGISDIEMFFLNQLVPRVLRV